MLPSVHAGGVERAVHLVVAQRSDRSLSLVEAVAALVPFQAQELNEARELLARIRHHVFVAHVKYRQVGLALPVFHESAALIPCGGNPFHARGPRVIRVVETSHEAAHGHVARIADGVDHASLWEEPRKQPHDAVVTKRLVHDAPHTGRILLALGDVRRGGVLEGALQVRLNQYS